MYYSWYTTSPITLVICMVMISNTLRLCSFLLYYIKSFFIPWFKCHQIYLSKFKFHSVYLMMVGTAPSPRYECRISSSPFDIPKTNYKHQQVWFLLVGMNCVFLVQFWFPPVVLPWEYLTKYIYIFFARWDSDRTISRSTKSRRLET